MIRFHIADLEYEFHCEVQQRFSSAFGVFSLVLHYGFDLVSQAGETRTILEVMSPALLHQTVHLVLKWEKHSN